MRSRSILLVVAILLVSAFAALNWSEIIQSGPLSFGVFVMDAPLGLILLTLLGVTLVAFLVAAGTMHTQSLIESRQHFKSLEAQRDLADKAEASRFTDLRMHLDTQLRQLRERDAIAATELEKAVVQGQRDLGTQLDQINRTLASRLTELENRLDGRAGVSPASVALRQDRAVVVDDATLVSPQREAELNEERMREEARSRGEQPTPSDGKPADAGWRRWF